MPMESGWYILQFRAITLHTYINFALLFDIESYFVAFYVEERKSYLNDQMSILLINETKMI